MSGPNPFVDLVEEFELSDKDWRGIAYLTVKPESGGNLRVVKVTQSRPRIVEDHAVVVELKLAVPAEAFRPLKANLDVPVEAAEVVAEAPVDFR